MSQDQRIQSIFEQISKLNQSLPVSNIEKSVLLEIVHEEEYDKLRYSITKKWDPAYRVEEKIVEVILSQAEKLKIPVIAHP